MDLVRFLPHPSRPLLQVCVTENDYCSTSTHRYVTNVTWIPCDESVEYRLKSMWQNDTDIVDHRSISRREQYWYLGKYHSRRSRSRHWRNLFVLKVWLLACHHCYLPVASMDWIVNQHQLLFFSLAFYTDVQPHSISRSVITPPRWSFLLHGNLQ